MERAYARTGDPLWQRKTALVITRAIVAVAAPDELPLVEATAVASTRRGDRRDKDMLRTGLEGTIPVVTVMALAAAQAAVTFIATVVGDAVREESSGVIRAWLDRV